MSIGSSLTRLLAAGGLAWGLLSATPASALPLGPFGYDLPGAPHAPHSDETAPWPSLGATLDLPSLAPPHANRGPFFDGLASFGHSRPGSQSTPPDCGSPVPEPGTALLLALGLGGLALRARERIS